MEKMVLLYKRWTLRGGEERRTGGRSQDIRRNA
jgi:hypothetical protein